MTALSTPDVGIWSGGTTPTEGKTEMSIRHVSFLSHAGILLPLALQVTPRDTYYSGSVAVPCKSGNMGWSLKIEVHFQINPSITPRLRLTFPFKVMQLTDCLTREVGRGINILKMETRVQLSKATDWDLCHCRSAL